MHMRMGLNPGLSDTHPDKLPRYLNLKRLDKAFDNTVADRVICRRMHLVYP